MKRGFRKYTNYTSHQTQEKLKCNSGILKIKKAKEKERRKQTKEIPAGQAL
jgi:hypothetical protein